MKDKIDIASIMDNLVVVEDNIKEQSGTVKEQAKKEYQDYFKDSNIPKKYREAHQTTISNDLLAKNNGIFDTMKKEKFIVLKGMLGRGKSFLASAFLNTAFISSNLRGYFLRCHILETLDFNELKQLLNNIKNKKIVIVDDLGFIKSNDFVKRQVASFILYRQEEYLKTIITVNESVEDIFDDRIFNKIDEEFLWIEIKGDNLRKSKG